MAPQASSLTHLGEGSRIGALRSGKMPCDGAWPAPQAETFQRWIDAGKPAWARPAVGDGQQTAHPDLGSGQPGTDGGRS